MVEDSWENEKKKSSHQPFAFPTRIYNTEHKQSQGTSEERRRQTPVPGCVSIPPGLDCCSRGRGSINQGPCCWRGPLRPSGSYSTALLESTAREAESDSFVGTMALMRFRGSREKPPITSTPAIFSSFFLLTESVINAFQISISEKHSRVC